MSVLLMIIILFLISFCYCHIVLCNRTPSSFTLLHGTAYTVVRTTSCSYGKWQNWGYQNSETAETTVTKFGTGDCVGDMTPHAKIQNDCPSVEPALVAQWSTHSGTMIS